MAWFDAISGSLPFASRQAALHGNDILQMDFAEYVELRNCFAERLKEAGFCLTEQAVRRAYGYVMGNLRLGPR